ncbi:TIGR03086 family metal-binding protein [Streptacidiphilus sp. ASG 303]|uniref:TIGR03086 family metal-binding protein n=1 Tax=Streptomycetaceae TaxID=2062 RepID=UPI001E368212|nr:TIGR03086 family metal-binding protein [Streptacidiphilus sp. ASG 303]MCD0483863.1 TIGR03086 family metal-binding protein [Streptacidiphilus sp. ASG 303]
MAHTLTHEQQEVLRMHAEAVASFGRRVRAVGAGQWDAPTPCTEWTVRDLVNHLTVEQLWVPPLMEGATVEEVGDRFDGDRLGDDPVGAWRSAATAAREAFTRHGALDATVHLSSGDTRAVEYCSQMAMDAAVHTWDLARATGGDTRLAPELVAFARREVEPYADELAASGLFAPPVKVSDDADGQTRLLALLGRRA